jgi:hypothetical protein
MALYTERSIAHLIVATDRTVFINGRSKSECLDW